MQQQLESVATATADTLGAATFVFEAVPQGQTWWGSVQIAGAPFSALSSALVTIEGVPNAGTPWGSWAGPLAYGIVRAEGRQQLVINAQQLIPGTEYHATWLGIMDDSGEPIPEFPTAIAGSQVFPTGPFAAEQFSGVGSATLPAAGQYVTSNVPGAQWLIINNAVTPLIVHIQWTTQPATIGLALTGQRDLMLNLGGTAVFTHPHLGDLMSVQLVPLGGAVTASVVITNVDHGRTQWSTILDSGNGPEFLLFNTQTVNAGVGPIVVAQSFTCYAGPAFWNVISTNVVPNPAFIALLQAQDLNGNWRNIARIDNTEGTTGAGQLVKIPPLPIRVQYSNLDTNPHLFSTSLVADSWH